MGIEEVVQIKITNRNPRVTVASNKFWSSMSFQNLVRQISLLDYAHVNEVSKNLEKNDN
jgi:hypothetical protein